MNVKSKKLILIIILLNVSVIFGQEIDCSNCDYSTDNNFCSNCGCEIGTIIGEQWTCSNCNLVMYGNFCSNCGAAKEVAMVMENVPEQKLEKTEIREHNVISAMEADEHEPVVVKSSNNKHKAYIKDYVGMIPADIGEYDWFDKVRKETYWECGIKCNFISINGNYIDSNKKSDLDDYIVVSQSIEPNTELNIQYEKTSDGEDFTSVTKQSITEIDFIVAPISRYASKINYATDHIPVITSQSFDRHEYFIKDYVGRNLGSVGIYSQFYGYLSESYGQCDILFNIITENGEYVDVSKDAKNYVVVGQSVEPNTSFIIQYDIDDNGNETDDYSYKNIQEIDLFVKTVHSRYLPYKLEKLPVPVNISPDKYTYYIKDYFGRNLASFGQTSFMGYRYDNYGRGSVKFKIIADDGTNIDIDNVNELKKYFVISQSVKPNTELKYTYTIDNNGKESIYPATSSIEEITLYVTLVQ